MIRAWATLGCALAVLAGGATSARAYVFDRTSIGQPKRWASPCLTLVVETGTTPRDLSPELARAAVEGAAEVWTNAQQGCSALDIRVQTAAGERSSGFGYDAVSRVFFRRPRVLPPGVRPTINDSVLALTTTAATRDGVILSADIEINTIDATFGDLVANPDSDADHDLQNVMAHEIGHLLGLAHTCHAYGEPNTPRIDHEGEATVVCELASDAIKRTTMVATVARRDVERRTLEPDDVAGICALYPADDHPRCEWPVQSIGPGCGVAPGPQTPTGAVALGLAAWLGALARRRRAQATPRVTATPAETLRIRR